MNVESDLPQEFQEVVEVMELQMLMIRIHNRYSSLTVGIVVANR